MQEKHLFSYSDYKKYLNDRLDTDPKGRGSRSALSRAIQCQTAYVSNVLRGYAHFTPEQGEAINKYLAHTESEADFFLLMLHYHRAGTESLRQRLQNQMDKIQEQRFDLKKRLLVKPVLASEDQAIFYSAWYFAAIHALVSIPGYQNINSIAAYLNLEILTVSEVVEFLIQTGLLVQVKNTLKIGKSQTHLGSESPLISKHHINWRLLSMQKISNKKSENLHYSSVISLSEKDVRRIKEMVIVMIKDAKKIIGESKEETLQCFAIDFFKI